MTSLKRFYVGTIVNRDLEVFKEITKFLKTNYNLIPVNLLKDNLTFSLKHFKKLIKRNPLSFLIVKLTSQESNQEINEAIEEKCSNIPILNSMSSVNTCESRSKTFELLEEKCKNVMIPDTFHSYDQAFKACSQGIPIIIKLDQHNIPNFPKNDRIIGVAENTDILDRLVKNYLDQELFFQEYLGEFDIIYKAYVVGRWLVSITSQNRLQQDLNLNPIDLIHLRVEVPKQFKRRIIRIGRKFGMSVYGIDYIKTENGTFIVDVNDFPSFRSIPEGVSLISDHIYNIISTREQELQAFAKVRIK